MSLGQVKLFALAVLLGAGTARAEIGDNLDQLRARYGEPSKHTISNDGTVFGLWRWEQFVLLVGFRNGVSHHEALQRLNGAPMSSADLGKCLPFSKWKANPGNVWESSDKKAVASYSASNRELVIYSREWLDAHGGGYSPVTIELWIAALKARTNP
jgi:hypothetical protein